jgi:hypothetical protein
MLSCRAEVLGKFVAATFGEETQLMLLGFGAKPVGDELAGDPWTGPVVRLASTDRNADGSIVLFWQRRRL